MKVYWVVSNYPHEYNLMAGVFYKHFAESLILEKIDLSIIAPTPYCGKILAVFSKKWKIYYLSPRKEEVNGVKILRPRYFTHPGEVYYGIPHYFIYRSLIKLNLPKPDLIHGYGGYPFATAAIKYANHFDIPIINTFIGSDANVFPQKNSLSFKRFQNILNCSTKTLTVSKALSEEIKKAGGVSSEVLYIPFATDTISNANKNQLRQKLSLPPDKFIVIYAGYLYASKGINELVEALKKLEYDENIFAVFCGGPTTLLNKILNLPNAEYLGLLPVKKVCEYMRAADVLVLPSYSEGIPGVIKEAALAGLPVVATNVGGIPELLNDDRGYMMDAKNSAQIIEALLYVKNNYKEALARAEKLKEYVTEKFNPQKVSGQMRAVYENILKDRKK